MIDKILRKPSVRSRNTTGFTLLELLVSILIGWIVISALLYFVVQLTKTDREELARTQTEQEMSMAVDYMASELKEAVYVYEGECINNRRGSPGDTDFCPGLTNVIDFDDDVRPVLAFWKLDRLPYSDQAEDQFPANCNTNTDLCNAAKLQRNSYTLVVYSFRTDSGTTWDGPAQLSRYHLRQYAPRPARLSNLTQTNSYVSPETTGFAAWPCGTTCPSQQSYSESGNAKNADVLVDFVDDRNTPAASCPSSPGVTPSVYSSSILNDVSSFYACIRRPRQGDSQDVIVNLRGNALERAGLSENNRQASYLPGVQAQVQTKSTLNRDPSQPRQ